MMRTRRAAGIHAAGTTPGAVRGSPRSPIAACSASTDAASGSPLTGSFRARWNALIAAFDLLPQMPSTPFGSKTSESSAACTSRKFVVRLRA